MRNYSVLLVDDESFVVDWIYELLDIHLGSSLSIYKAYTTQRALEIAGSTKIDLLITDINMPEINGLAMVDRIAAIWPMCKSVLLTGHPSFDYAQEAIRKGISSYVLKTSGDKEILSEVQQALKLGIGN
jgi:two-component system response regulator YesN